MATVALTSENRGSVQTVSWLNLTTNDYGQPWQRADYSDKSFHVLGDFGSGATVSLWGSNVPNPSLANDDDWFALTDTTETALSFTSATGGQILQNPRWISPKVVSGTNTACDIHIEATRNS